MSRHNEYCKTVAGRIGERRMSNLQNLAQRVHAGYALICYKNVMAEG